MYEILKHIVLLCDCSFGNLCSSELTKDFVETILELFCVEGLGTIRVTFLNLFRDEPAFFSSQLKDLADWSKLLEVDNAILVFVSKFNQHFGILQCDGLWKMISESRLFAISFVLS